MKKITDSELYLIKILWEKGESSAKDVFLESLKDKKRSYQTIKTLLDRMVERGFSSRRKFGPIWLYTAKVSKSKITSDAISHLIENVLDNGVFPVFTYMIKNNRIKKDEVSMIKEMLDQIEEE